jgi:hypothetical protein
MKNLLIYYNPAKKFMPVRNSPTNYDELTRIQIDNALELGWKPEDLVLVMNFSFEYRGIKAFVVGEGKYDVFDGNRSSKLPVICQMFKDGLIVDDIYWFHDHDAFQLESFDGLDMTGYDILYTDHGWTSMWNAGSFFFNKKSGDIWDLSKDVMYKRNINEQTSLIQLMRENPAIEKRCKKINITYNYGIYYHPVITKLAQRPLRVVHFQPHKQRHLNLYTPLITERFINLLKKYGLSAN